MLDLYNKAKDLSDKYNIPFDNDTFDEQFIHGYLLTIARSLFQ